MTPTEKANMRNQLTKLARCEQREEIARKVSATIYNAIIGSNKQTLRSVSAESGVPFTRLSDILYNGPHRMTVEIAKKVLRVLK